MEPYLGFQRFNLLLQRSKFLCIGLGLFLCGLRLQLVLFCPCSEDNTRLDLGATNQAAMCPRVENLPAASKESDKVPVAVLLCSFTYVSFCGPHLVEACLLFPVVYHRHLLAVHQDAVAGKDVDDEELLVWLAFDLLQQSFPDFVDGDFARINQQSHIVQVVATKGISDYVYVFVDFR